MSEVGDVVIPISTAQRILRMCAGANSSKSQAVEGSHAGTGHTSL